MQQHMAQMKHMQSQLPQVNPSMLLSTKQYAPAGSGQEELFSSANDNPRPVHMSGSDGMLSATDKIAELSKLLDVQRTENARSEE